MLLIAGLSLWSFLLLIQTRNKVPVSFGDMGGVLFGPAMRLFVLVCITVSQVSQASHIISLDILASNVVLLLTAGRVCLRLHGLCGSKCTCFHHVC
jgi:hypothetical protein